MAIETNSDNNAPAKKAVPVTAEQVRELAQIPSNLIPQLITLGLAMAVLSQMTIEVSKAKISSSVSTLRSRLPLFPL